MHSNVLLLGIESDLDISLGIHVEDVTRNKAFDNSISILSFS